MKKDDRIKIIKSKEVIDKVIRGDLKYLIVNDRNIPYCGGAVLCDDEGVIRGSIDYKFSTWNRNDGVIVEVLKVWEAPSPVETMKGLDSVDGNVTIDLPDDTNNVTFDTVEDECCVNHIEPEVLPVDGVPTVSEVIPEPKPVKKKAPSKKKNASSK